jgi:hypothetical protein
MGRVNQAMQRARQVGIVTEFETIAGGAYDASVLAAEPFPAEDVQEPAAAVAPDAPPTVAASGHDDQEIQEIFFNTYPEKVWDGSEAVVRLSSLLAKVERAKH